MKRVRILHLGDIHYPDWLRSQTDADVKDHQLPTITTAVTAHPVTRILRTLINKVAEGNFDFVVQVGDLTTKGEIKHIATAVKHLSYILQSRSMNANQIHCALVPGNHDINRELAAKAGMNGKFEPLQEPLQLYGWPSFPIDGICVHPVPAAMDNVSIILLNTCIGCGEKRYFPSTVGEAMQKAINKALLPRSGRRNQKRKIKALTEYYETLDTPAIHSVALTELEQYLDELPKAQLPIIVAHHNILPQGQPRLAPYGELLNAGQLRRTLLTANRPILFLHGHIHTDPIEIIRDPRMPNAQIISVSAPELKDGFCELAITIDKSARPRCCRLTQYKYRPDTGAAAGKPLDIFLMPGVIPVHAELADFIRQRLWLARRLLWYQLRADLESEHRAVEDIRAKLDSTVEELYFAQQIIVENPESDPSLWILSQ